MKKLNEMTLEELKDTCREYGVMASNKSQDELIVSLAKTLELNRVPFEWDPIEVEKEPEEAAEEVAKPKKKKVKYIGEIPEDWDKKKVAAWKKHYREFFAEGGETEDEVAEEMAAWSPEYDEALAAEVEEGPKERKTPSNAKLIEFDGKAQTIAAWSKELGIGYGTIRDRIYKMGWSIEKALSTPVSRSSGRSELYEFNGETQSLSEWSKELGIGYGTLYDRIHKMGWSIEKALSTYPKHDKKDDMNVEPETTEE